MRRTRTRQDNKNSMTPPQRPPLLFSELPEAFGGNEASRRWARRGGRTASCRLRQKKAAGAGCGLSPLSRPRALLPLMPPRGPRLGSSRPKTAPFRPWELGAFRSCESRAELALAFEEALGTSRFISGGLFRGDEDERQETIKTPTKLVLQSSVSRRASHATAPGVLWPRGTPLTSAPFDTHKCKTQARGKHLAGLRLSKEGVLCPNDDELQRRSGQQEPNLPQITFIFQKYVTGTSVKIITRFE